MAGTDSGVMLPQKAADPIAGLRRRLARGLVIPACPLALTAERRFDARHQRGLIRYYGNAGAGGLAVGVHTTQFAIHDSKVGLYRPVLELAAETMRMWPGRKSGISDQSSLGGRPSAVGGQPVAVAGLVGDTAQACREAAFAISLGYDCGLLSLAALRGASDDALIAHCRAVAEILPVFGFYLQPAVGGRVLSYAFWRHFAEIEHVVAIKIAPFNRYQTLDVVRAVADSGRRGEIALYTGNDDHIIEDLLAEFRFGDTAAPQATTGAEPVEAPALRQAQGAATPGEGVAVPALRQAQGAYGGEAGLRIVGGLLGHWAVWTRRAVEILEACHMIQREMRSGNPPHPNPLPPGERVGVRGFFTCLPWPRRSPTATGRCST